MSARELTQRRLEELEKIQRQNGGVLNPGDVVEHARNPNSALHSYFQWDDSVAAAQFRLVQARTLIRVLVTIEKVGGADRKIRAFVSISDDRKSGGGYRQMIDVMADGDLRAKLLSTALTEMRGFKKRYAELNELAHVFESIDETISVLEPVHEQRATA